VVKESLPENPETVAGPVRETPASVSVREFMTAPALGLEIEVLQGQDYLENEICSARVQKLGMVLAGFDSYIHPDRVQLIGTSEVNFLKALNGESRWAAIQRLRKRRICCIVVTKGLDVPEELLKLSSEEKIPILRCAAIGSVSIARITGYLEKRLAPRITIHGVLLEVFGLGVLILGPSGIGKSECALELVLKGHRLITDDYVELTRRGIDRLSGSGGKVLRHHMELRGLGIINIRDLFGISATSTSHIIDFAVRLERWKSDAEYDRLGLEHSSIEYLGVPIPIIDMPVAPGRNVSTLVEVAARIQLLRQRGYRPAIQSEEMHPANDEGVQREFSTPPEAHGKKRI
jgi:HPr kinase/phosphorylase